MENNVGYWLKVEDKAKDSSRWLPVDTPQQLVKKLCKDDTKPQTLPKPPQIIQYSEKEANSLKEQLRKKETFQPALKILIKWLERGMCTERNVIKIFHLINGVNSYSLKLKAQKEKTEEDLRKAKIVAAAQRQTLLIHLRDIDHLFQVACHKKVWDRFTNAQRKRIKLWKLNLERIRQNYTDEILKDRQEDEMELSDNDMTEINDDQEKKELTDKITKLNTEVDSLRCELDKAHQELSEFRSIQIGKESSEFSHVKLDNSLLSECLS